MDRTAKTPVPSTTACATTRRAAVKIFLRDLKVGTRFMLMRNGQKYTLLGLGMYKNRWTYTVQRDCESYTSTLHHSCHVKPLERTMTITPKPSNWTPQYTELRDDNGVLKQRTVQHTPDGQIEILYPPQDQYASEQETEALIKPDTRTPYAQMLDQMLEIRGANDQGAEPYKILYRITVELLEAYYHGTEAQP